MQQAIADHVNQAVKAAEEDAIVTSVLEETGREGSTQAYDKQPKSSDNPTTADPVLEIARNAAQGLLQQQQARQSCRQARCVLLLVVIDVLGPQFSMVASSRESTSSRGWWCL